MDTNAIIDYLENRLPAKTNKLIENFPIQMSVISRMEILAWQKASDSRLNFLKDFISASVVFNLDESIILRSIEIRKKYRLKLPDAIIAATAVSNNLHLLTRNTKDFTRVIELECTDPYK